MAIVPTRVLVICVTATLIGTMYSLSQLYEVSTAMALKADLRAERDRMERKTISTSVSTVSSPAVATTKAPSTSAVGGAVATTQDSAKVASNAARKSFTYPNTELWGDVVKWGNTNMATSIEECGNTCKQFTPAQPDDPLCNVFVWCGDKERCKAQFGECWLKHLPHAEASKPSRQGPEVGWTAGTLDVDMNADPSKDMRSDGNRKFHVVTSAQGAAVHWQCRIHYYWYQKHKAACEKAGPCDMGGWTRLLHSGKADDLMDELPTMVVDPLPKSLVENNWYVVLNRPYAFVQWAEKAIIPERYVLMAEPDHVFLRPLPNFMKGDVPASFPFFYIEPTKPDYKKIVEKFTGPMTKKDLEEIAPIGNSPTYMTLEAMKKVMPVWMNTSIGIFKDRDASKAWGWVQEMYGFALALWICGIKQVDLYLNMMSQPPWDTKMELAPGRPFYILHYTYGMDYTLDGEFTPGKVGAWRFDKRTYSGSPPPRHLGDPPTGMKNELVRHLINSLNEATEAVPCWDQYVKSREVPKTCDEQPQHFLAEKAAADQAS